MRLQRYFLLAVSGLLNGLSIATLVTMLILASKLETYSKDLSEVINTWFYMAVFGCISGLAAFIGVGFYLKTRGVL